MRILETHDAVLHLRGRWVVMSWDQSFTTRPVRPLLRMTRSRGDAIESVLPAATFGRAHWLGRMPDDLQSYGLFADVADSASLRFHPVRTPGAWPLRARLALRSPLALLGDIVPGAIRTSRGRINNMRSALMLAPLEDWERVAARNTRVPEPDGFDRPVPPDGAPRICLLLRCGPGDVARLARTLDALAAQVDGSWSLDILADDPGSARAAKALVEARRLAGIVGVEATAGRGADGRGVPPAMEGSGPGWVGWLDPGDRPAVWAILAVRSALAAKPGIRLLYTDSAVGGPGGALALKPAWSPHLLASGNYIGGMCLLDPALVQDCAGGLDVRGRGDLWPALLRAAEVLPDQAVSHLPRVAVIHDRASPAGLGSAATGRPAAAPASAAAPTRAATVSIVVPTRDRLDLLKPAVESVLERTAGRNFELVVADNASTDSATLAFLRAIHGTPRTRVMSVAGEFNFSRIVNAAVATTNGEIVLLLNNDVEVVTPDWIDELSGLASRPDVGAAGAKLLYPDGTLQHVGIVLGWGGYAGHFGRRQPAETPGHLGRRLVPHEVSAVTAACLAVSRSHFDAIGGFDEGFAVAFNDVDFCLRLRARGLRNLVTPRAVLVHHESASRGHDTGPSRARFRDERRRFGERWRDVIQDDPYFHVALSLNKNTEFLE